MATDKHNRFRGIVALFFLAFVFATFGIFNRYLSQNFSAYQIQYMRVLIALIFSFIFFYKNLHFKKMFTLPKKEWLILLTRAMLFYAFASVINIQAFNHTLYSNVSFLQAIPTTALLGMLFLQEKVTVKKVLIIIMVFIGVFLISAKDFAHIFTWGEGQIDSLLADLFFSLLYVSRKWHSKLLNNKEITFMIFLFSFIILLVSSLLFFDKSLPLNGWNINYLFIIILASFFVFFNQFLVNYGMEHVEPLLANNILSLESIFALCIGILLYKEFPSLQALLGSSLILLSIPLMNREETNKS